MRSKAHFAGKAVLGLVAVATLGWVVMGLWNAVVPTMFIDARQIDYLHALGLLVLCRILFGGFRGYGGHFGRHARRRWGQWQAMTPDERDQVRQSGTWGKPRPGESE